MNPRIALLSAALSLAGCVTSSESPQFSSEKYSMKQASQENVALGIRYLQQGQRDVAMQKIQKALQQDSDNAQAYMAEAMVYAVTGDSQRAEDNYKIALRKGPDDPEIQNNYATYLCQHGRPKDSVDYFLKAAVNPLYATPDWAYANAGLCAGQIPDPAASEQYFRRALQINPNLPGALFGMAQLSYNQKKYLQARAFIERYTALAGQPDSGVQLSPDILMLGVQTEQALGNRQGASDYVKQIYKRFPDSPQAQQLSNQAGGHAGNPG
ncbi:MAG TPA: type IV pilus biogenesis/stability protein PilW [Gammaproteobacteria bacterium]|nr:type IV pilus biogenesis/stability protein PilW [Gammaproteobacteria bacterium]